MRLSPLIMGRSSFQMGRFRFELRIGPVKPRTGSVAERSLLVEVRSRQSSSLRCLPAPGMKFGASRAKSVANGLKNLDDSSSLLLVDFALLAPNSIPARVAIATRKSPNPPFQPRPFPFEPRSSLNRMKIEVLGAATLVC